MAGISANHGGPRATSFRNTLIAICETHDRMAQWHCDNAHVPPQKNICPTPRPATEDRGSKCIGKDGCTEQAFLAGQRFRTFQVLRSLRILALPPHRYKADQESRLKHFFLPAKSPPVPRSKHLYIPGRTFALPLPLVASRTDNTPASPISGCHWFQSRSHVCDGPCRCQSRTPDRRAFAISVSDRKKHVH